MKRSVKLIGLSFILSSVLSCAGIEETSESELGLSPVEIEVSISSDSLTKVSMGESDGSSTPFYWSDGEEDRFKVTIDETDYYFRKVGITSQATSARFRCEGVPEIVPGKIYTARYDNNSIAEVYSAQVGTSDSIENEMDMTASYTAKEGDTWEDVVFNFQYCYALLHIKVTSHFIKDQYVYAYFLNGSEELVRSTGTIKGDESGIADIYFVVAPGEYTEPKLEVWAYGDDINKRSVISLSRNTLKAGNIYNIFKETTDFIDAHKLSEGGTANCYIMDRSTEEKRNFQLYGFDATYKGGSNKASDMISEQIKYVKVLWESFGTSEVVNAGDLIGSVRWHTPYICFTPGNTDKEGNALIGAFDENDQLVWSWHIWVTDTPAAHEYINDSSDHFGTYMDRNLGALTATPGEAGIAGLLYQWGRKDPFLTSGDIASATPNTVASSVLSEDMQWMVIPSNQVVGTVAFATKNPTTFITGVSPNYSWLHTPDISLWGNYKTIYDPCPAGWKVAQSELGVNLRVIFYVGEPVFTFGCGKTLYDRSNEYYAYYPASGHLNFQSGDLEHVSKAGFIWSSTVASNGSPYGFMFDENTEVDFDYKFYSSQGASVRCQKIE